MTGRSQRIVRFLVALLLVSMVLASSPALVLGQVGSPVAADLDFDAVADEFENCVDLANPDQLDSDGDWLGDPCDLTPNGDSDGDGVDEWSDRCPGFNDLLDQDGSGIPDGCDLPPTESPIPTETTFSTATASAVEPDMAVDASADDGNTPAGDWISVDLDCGFRVIFQAVAKAAQPRRRS